MQTSSLIEAELNVFVRFKNAIQTRNRSTYNVTGTAQPAISQFSSPLAAATTAFRSARH
jgi:hypothetical protein